MRFFKILSFALVIGLALPLLAACPKAPASVVTPQGRAAFKADQVLARIENLEDVVIRAGTPDAAGHRVISKADADLIVGFCKDAALVIRQTPDGWLAAVRVLWDRAAARIPPADLPAVQGYVLMISVLLEGAGA